MHEMKLIYKVQMDDSKQDLSLALHHSIENLLDNFDTVERWENVDEAGDVLVASDD